ncbi:MAG: DUF4190 domain-containing protein [bacterium]
MIEHKTSGKAITSMVCGILSIILPFVGFILGVLAIIFSIVARNEIKHSEGKIVGTGMATAGLVCGIVGLIAVIFWISIVGLIFKLILSSIKYWMGSWYY